MMRYTLLFAGLLFLLVGCKSDSVEQVVGTISFDRSSFSIAEGKGFATHGVELEVFLEPPPQGDYTISVSSSNADLQGCLDKPDRCPKTVLHTTYNPDNEMIDREFEYKQGLEESVAESMPFIRKIHSYLCQGGTFNYDNAADIVIEKFDSMEDSRSSGDFYAKFMNFPPEVRVDLNKAIRQKGYDPDIPPLSNFLRYENETERDCSLSIIEIEETIKKNMIEAKSDEGDIQVVLKGINFAAAEDSDTVDDTGTITFKVMGEGYSNSPTATIDFTIIDND